MNNTTETIHKGFDINKIWGKVVEWGKSCLWEENAKKKQEGIKVPYSYGQTPIELNNKPKGPIIFTEEQKAQIRREAMHDLSSRS